MRSLPEDLRVLLLNHNSRGVGTFFRAWHLARHLARRGVRVSLVTVSPSRRVLPYTHVTKDVRVEETPNLLTLVHGLGAGHGTIGIPYRVMLALRCPYDLIHAFDHKPSVLLPAVLGKKIRNEPMVADWSDWWGQSPDHSSLQERRWGPVIRLETSMEEYIHQQAYWVTAISSGLKDRAVALGISRTASRGFLQGHPRT